MELHGGLHRRAHAAKNSRARLDGGEVGGESGAEGGIDDGDIILLAAALLESKEKFVRLAQRDGEADDDLVGLEGGLAIASEEAAGDGLLAGNELTGLLVEVRDSEDGAGGHVQRVQIGDRGGGDEVSAEGCGVSDLTAGEPLHLVGIGAGDHSLEAVLELIRGLKLCSKVSQEVLEIVDRGRAAEGDSPCGLVVAEGLHLEHIGGCDEGQRVLVVALEELLDAAL